MFDSASIAVAVKFTFAPALVGAVEADPPSLGPAPENAGAVLEFDQPVTPVPLVELAP